MCCTTVGKGIARQATAAGCVSSRNGAKGNSAMSDTTVWSSRNLKAPNTSLATGGRTAMMTTSLASNTAWLVSSRDTFANLADNDVESASFRGDKKISNPSASEVQSP